MASQTETAPTVEEMDAALAALELYMDRNLEAAQAQAAAPSAFAAYWAGSATASIMRDYRTGRVVTIRA